MKNLNNLMTNRTMHEPKHRIEEKPSGAAWNFSQKRRTLDSITRRFEEAGVDYVVGGSGMLLGLGLTDDVRDWDLMTDATEAEVRAALADMELVGDSGPSELYGSGCKLRIEGTKPEVEVILGFAIRAGGEVCRMPALTHGIRNGMRIASPEVWMAAYALMGRHEKSALLERYLHENGADAEALARLREEPLPAELAGRLNRLP